MSISNGLALDLRGVAKSYARRFGFARTPVLAGVDLAVERGSALGLAGPNGSGKSTLLRIAAGVETEDAGTVRVLGRDARASARADEIGWMGDDSLYPSDMSIGAALKLAGAMHGLRGRELVRRADERLERVGLRRHAHQSLGRSSRGMLRRFGIAQAWIHDPKLVLLDEPTAGLDAEGFVVLHEILDEARAAGTTVVIASHASSDFAGRCDVIAVLVDGRIAASGAPDAVLGGGGLLEIYRRSARAVP